MTTGNDRTLWPEILLLLALAAVGVGLVAGRVGLVAGVRNTLCPPATPTSTPALGVLLALPGGKFVDRGAFLAAGQEVHLLAYDGGELRLTAPARVVAVAVGTPPAVQVDMKPIAAAAFRAMLPDADVRVQYVPLTPTPKPSPTPTPPPTPTPTPGPSPTPTPGPSPTPTPTAKPLLPCGD